MRLLALAAKENKRISLAAALLSSGVGVASRRRLLSTRFVWFLAFGTELLLLHFLETSKVGQADGTGTHSPTKLANAKRFCHS